MFNFPGDTHAVLTDAVFSSIKAQFMFGVPALNESQLGVVMFSV